MKTGFAPGINAMPPLPLSTYLRPPRKKMPFPLGDPRCRLFSLARRGLFAGVKALGLRPGDELLVPAYHHGSEIEALLKAGLVCRFYDVGEESLDPDGRGLEALLGPRVKALYLTHYLGFPQDAARWRKWCDERGLLLVEDAAQAWPGSRDGAPVGSHGDLSILCLYKTFGLADGAAVLCGSPPEASGDRSAGLKPTARRHVSYLMQRWPWLAEVRRKTAGAPPPYDPRLDFALGDSRLPAPRRAFFSRG